MKLKICFSILAALPCTLLHAHYTCPDTQTESNPVRDSAGWLMDTEPGVPSVFETQRLGPALSDSNQNFGQDMSLNGKLLAVSRDGPNEGESPEQIALFEYSNGSWQLIKEVVAPNPQEEERFSVPSIYGTTLLVGAWNHCPVGTPDLDCEYGAAYLFEKSSGGPDNWGLTKQLKGNVLEGRFGSSVALEKDTAVISAAYETINGVWSAGAVYIFGRNQGGAGKWGQVARLESDATKKVEGDFFGYQLLLIEDTLWVNGDDLSVIYEFQRNLGGTNNWGLAQKIPVPEGQAFFTTDGQTLVLSINDPCVAEEGRKVRLAFYSKDELGTWQQDQVIEKDYDPYRLRDMALEGNTLVAHTQDYETVAHVYRRGPTPDSWALDQVLRSSETMNLRYGAIGLDQGRALISYPYADYDGIENKGAVFYYELDKPINTHHSGAWANLATLGQGQLIDVDAENQFIFLAWFTYTDADSDHPNEQRWLTAQGNYSGNKAVLPLYETLGGAFDDPQAVTTEQIGEATLSFTDCGLARLYYRIDGEGLSGDFPIERVVPGSEANCESPSENTLQAVDINAGMDGAWFDENSPGQGFLFDVQPDPEGGNFIFAAWFTYGDDTASGQRWLTAQGRFEGSTAVIDVHETTAGSFNDPQGVNTEKVGTMTIDFQDCNNAQLSYDLTDDSLKNSIEISRAIPGTQALCEELDTAEQAR